MDGETSIIGGLLNVAFLFAIFSTLFVLYEIFQLVKLRVFRKLPFKEGFLSRHYNYTGERSPAIAVAFNAVLFAVQLSLVFTHGPFLLLNPFLYGPIAAMVYSAFLLPPMRKKGATFRVVERYSQKLSLGISETCNRCGAYGFAVMCPDCFLDEFVVAPQYQKDLINSLALAVERWQMPYGDFCLTAQSILEGETTTEENAIVLSPGQRSAASEVSSPTLKKPDPPQKKPSLFDRFGCLIYLVPVLGIALYTNFTSEKTTAPSASPAPASYSGPYYSSARSAMLDAAATPQSATSSPSRTPTPTTTEITGELGRTAYWTPAGKSYHFSRSCRAFARSRTINEGTLQDALDNGKTDPCNFCAHGN